MKIEDYNAVFDPEERIQLIKDTRDINFIRECIINKNLDLSIYYRVRLLELTECLLDIEFEEYSLADLALTGGMEFCKACIKEGFIFKGWQARSLIDKMRYLVGLQDKESEKDYIDFVKECIYDEKLELSGLDKILIIEDLGIFVNSEEEKEEHVKFIKECIKDEELGWRSRNRQTLIFQMNKFIDLANKENLEEYIEFIKDEKIGLDYLSIAEIIIEIKSLIGLNDKENLDICRETLKDVIIHLEDEEVIEYLKEMKDFILPGDQEGLKDYENFQKRLYELLKLQIRNEENTDIQQKMDKIKVMSFLINEKDKESVEDYKKCIEMVEKTNELYPTESTVLKILKGNIEEINQELGIDYLCEGEFTEIDLPEGMTIGIEIEAEGDLGEELVVSKVLGWEAKEDGSIDGVEMTSPILRASKEDSKRIYQICALLDNMRQYITEKCGGHIHIGADYLKSKEAYANLLEIWGNSEEVLYIISNAVGEITRIDALETYAPPISKKIQTAIEKGRLDLNSEDDLEEFQEQIQNMQGNDIKYSSINFINVNTKMNTIEFRLPNGTLDAETWIENINLFGGLVKASQELADISEKNPEELTESDKKKIEIFEKIKSRKLDEKELLECVLNLSVSEDKKNIYIERYKINSILIKKSREEKRQLKKQLTSEPIKLKRKKLGKALLLGENAINGGEVEQTRAYIMQELEKDNREIEETK